MAQTQQRIVHEQFFVSETPGVMGGYPCVGNTRIPVRLIVDFTRAGMSIAELLEHYPQLTADQIRGALAFYATHPERVDEDRATNEQAFAALRARR